MIIMCYESAIVRFLSKPSNLLRFFSANNECQQRSLSNDNKKLLASQSLDIAAFLLTELN